MDKIDWVLIYSIFVLSSCALMILAQILLRLTLDRRIRSEMPPDKVYNFFADWYFGYGRAICFGYASCFDWANNSWVIKEHYEGFNIKAFANVFEKTMGYMMMFGGIVTITAIPITAVMKVYGLL